MMRSARTGGADVWHVAEPLPQGVWERGGIVRIVPFAFVEKEPKP